MQYLFSYQEEGTRKHNLALSFSLQGSAVLWCHTIPWPKGEVGKPKTGAMLIEIGLIPELSGRWS